MTAVFKFCYWLSIFSILTIAMLSCIFLGWQIGIAILIAIPSFMIAYSLSGKMIISRRDKYTRSEWSVFCKQIGWSWSVALVVYALAYILIAYNCGDPMEVLPVN